MTYRAHLVMVAAVVLAACGDDTSFDEAGRNGATLATDSALHAKAGRKIGGTVSGLAGTGLVLELNGDGTLAVQANGRFHFDQKLPTGAAYAVTVKTQPTSVVQTCAVSNGTGVVVGNVKSVSVICSPTGTFVGTGDLATSGRSYHSATRLPNGQVLIVGGLTPPSYDLPTPSAELYDPVTGTFTVTGSLNTARCAHSATLLPNGKVLIAGGSTGWYGGAYPMSSAELYDPSTGSFAPTGSMNLQRAAHTATLLPNGKVLIVAGYAGDFVRSNSAEVYDPATGTFTPTGSPAADRHSHSATLLGDGKVLVVGGLGSPLLYDAMWPTFAELYDPTSQTFTSLPCSRDGTECAALIGDVVGLPTVTLLPDGKALIAGTIRDLVRGAGAVLYDPATQQFTDGGTLMCPREYHTATLLTNGAVLLAGGRGARVIDGSWYSFPCASGEVFDPMTLSFAPTDTPQDCDPTSATSLVGGNVLITCGSGGAQLYEILPPLE